MSDQVVSRGQPERSVALLWRAEPRPGRGPKRGLTIDAIAVRAIELADTEGLAGLSMRRLADALGVRPMTLYTYLPAKGDWPSAQSRVRAASQSASNTSRASRWKRIWYQP
jgi:hypothetical protein